MNVGSYNYCCQFDVGEHVALNWRAFPFVYRSVYQQWLDSINSLSSSSRKSKASYCWNRYIGWQAIDNFSYFLCRTKYRAVVICVLGIPDNLRRLSWLSAMPTTMLTRGLDPKIFITDDFGSSSVKSFQALFYGSQRENLQELLHQFEKPEEPNEIQLQRLKAGFPDVREHFDNGLFSWSTTGNFLFARCGTCKDPL